MEKPESGRTLIAGIVVGGLVFGAGYLTGRSSHDPPAPSPPADERVEDDLADPPRPDPTARRPRAPHPRRQPRVALEPTDPPAPAPRPPGAAQAADREMPVHAGADETSPVIGTIPRGAALHVLESRADYRLVARPDDDTVAFGWVLWWGARGVFGTATLRGTVDFTGRPPEMRVPKKRKDAEFCKTKDVKYNAVVVNDGKLADVLVRLASDAVPGDYRPPTRHAEIAQVDCMYTPRIQGVVAGQTIDIENADGTLHNVHTRKGVETWFNKPQIKGSAPIAQELPDVATIVKFTCDVHPWMRGFVVVSTHPFFAVTGADGAFAIEKVPAGVHTVEAWHPHYGLKTARLRVEEGKTAEVVFRYDGTEPEPAENRDELKDLF